MSKPSLILYDGAGINNQDLAKSTARYIKGGSWKKQRIVVLMPTSDLIPAKVVLSWLNLAYPPNQQVVRILATGMEVGDAYSHAIEQVLADPNLSQWEYILTVEHDNCPPSDGVIRLIQRMEERPDLAAIGGLYWIKGEGAPPQIWGDPKCSSGLTNYRPQPPDPNGGLVECCGIAQGFSLFRMSMFRDTRLARPLFKTMKGMNGEGVGTQDLMFWNEARKYGYRAAIDCGCKVGHYDHVNDMMW